MEHTSNVQEPWFSYISQGLKTVEGRLNKGKFKDYRVGDKVTWSDPYGNRTETMVVSATIYRSFKEMLTSEGMKHVLPGEVLDISSGVKVYRRFYSKEAEDQYGVLAIGLSRRAM